MLLLLLGGAHAGGSVSKGSECGSNTAKFIEHIKPLLPDESHAETEFQKVWIPTNITVPINHDQHVNQCM